MIINNYDFKEMLDYLSNKYDISKEWILRNGVYLLYQLCDGLVSHEVDAESLLLSEDIAFRSFDKWIK